jgi:hypothetical protein
MSHEDKRKIPVNTDVDRLRDALLQYPETNAKTLLGNQMARRLLMVARNPISDYDLFDIYMESYGRLAYFDPHQKRTIRLTILFLLEKGLLREEGEGYVAAPEAVAEAERFVEWDLTPELVMTQLDERRAAAPALELDIGISTSTSTSCKCTSTSSSSASSSNFGFTPKGLNPLDVVASSRRIL